MLEESSDQGWLLDATTVLLDVFRELQRPPHDQPWQISQKRASFLGHADTMQYEKRDCNGGGLAV